MAENFEIQGVSSDVAKMHAQMKAGLQKAMAYEARQESMENAATDFFDGATFDPREMGKRFKELEGQFERPAADEAQETSEEQETSKSDETTRSAEHLEKSSEGEIHARSLLTILSKMHEGLSDDDMLETVLKSYPDPSLADDALDWLISSTKNRKEVQEKLILSKEKLNADQAREIKAGKNIASEARSFSKELGTPTSLRDLYRDITGNPREPVPLFEELSTKFDYQQMKKVIEFFLHSLGKDLKSKGPSIDLRELKRLLTDARQLQAILGVYSFFELRMAVIAHRFQKQSLSLPPNLNFILLAKLLVRFIKERFPSTNKFLQMAKAMGIENELLAQIIIFTQYRDAMRHTAPRLFQNERHRQDLLATILDALDELEDELDEDEEEEEE